VQTAYAVDFRSSQHPEQRRPASPNETD